MHESGLRGSKSTCCSSSLVSKGLGEEGVDEGWREGRGVEEIRRNGYRIPLYYIMQHTNHDGISMSDYH